MQDIFKQYLHKKVLITGNTGFKGSWLSLWLLELGANVYGYSNTIPTEPSLFKSLAIENKISQVYGDVRDLTKVKATIEEIKPDFIFHLAAQPIVSVSYSSPVETVTTNVIGTMNVLESLRILNYPCTAIIITSDKCYNNVEWVWGYKETDGLGGEDIYSGSKGAAELVFNSYYHSFFKKKISNVRVASARAGNVIGGGDWATDRIIPDAMRAWSQGKVVEIRSPEATRPWQHVLEPLSGYLNLGAELSQKTQLNGESFNFGPRAEYNRTVREILENLSVHWHFSDPNEAYTITDNLPFHEAGLLKLNCDKALFYLKWFASMDYKDLFFFTGDWYYQFYKTDTDMNQYTINQINNYIDITKNKGVTWAQ
ncbi:CDP-glucose 4,6-dehydratase [Spirochaetia bacterium]|nr:CDP-glucose 4,6-dehydratase [Spirochaetia bacterium]